MSYTKYPENTSPKQITFYYQSKNMFDNVSLRTMYRAKTLLNEKGEAMIDEYAMSADEEDAFKIFIADAVNDAFQIVLKMTTGVTDALILDQSVPISDNQAIVNCYGFKIVDEDAYNDNNLLTVDDGVKKYILYHVLASWWGLVAHKDEEIKFLTKRDEARTDLITNRLFQLRKKQYS